MNPTIHASDPYFPLMVVSLALIDRAMARPPVHTPALPLCVRVHPSSPFLCCSLPDGHQSFCTWELGRAVEVAA